MVPFELFCDQSKTLLISWTLSMPRGLTFMILGYRRSLIEWRSPSRCSNLFVLQIGSFRCPGGRRNICSSGGRCSFSCGWSSCWARPAAAAETNLVWYFGRCFIPWKIGWRSCYKIWALRFWMSLLPIGASSVSRWIVGIPDSPLFNKYSWLIYHIFRAVIA